MDNKKLIFIAVGVLVFLMVALGAAVVITNSGKSGGKLTKSMNEVIEDYIENINNRELDKAYEKLSAGTQEYVSNESFLGYIEVLMDEKNARISLDGAKETKTVQKKLSETEIMEYIQVPVIRTYTDTIDGKPHAMKDELELGIIETGEGYKIYMPADVYYNDILKYVLGKANKCAVEALEYKNDPSIVAQNVEKIDKYIGYARVIPDSYPGYRTALMEINLISGYKILAQGETENAISMIQSAYDFADTEEAKVRVKTVESEVFFSQGNYAEAVRVLKEALEIAPKNTEVRKDYRRINSMMIEQIETSLTSGWAQVESAIKQKEKEMKRILSDIALVEAEKAIKVKSDAPDGYYLKGNILYCLGDYNGAIDALEKALEVSNAEDTVFKTKVAEVLGIAKIAQASSDREFDASSYQQVFDSSLRSLLFRESEVSGIVDTIK